MAFYISLLYYCNAQLHISIPVETHPLKLKKVDYSIAGPTTPFRTFQVTTKSLKIDKIKHYVHYESGRIMHN